jgi:hypothetical protein
MTAKLLMVMSITRLCRICVVAALIVVDNVTLPAVGVGVGLLERSLLVAL